MANIQTVPRGAVLILIYTVYRGISVPKNYVRLRMQTDSCEIVQYTIHMTYRAKVFSILSSVVF